MFNLITELGLTFHSFRTDISNEMQVFIYNLSDQIFMETLAYLHNFALDYFEVIRVNIEKFDDVVLEVSRLLIALKENQFHFLNFAASD